MLFARRHYQLLDRSDLLDIHSGEHALEVVAGDLDGQQVTVWLVAGSCVVEQLTGNDEGTQGSPSDDRTNGTFFAPLG